ncbi:MAG: lytic transglycosylase domain-containing protein [Pseudobdellovibrio sp.]
MRKIYFTTLFIISVLLFQNFKAIDLGFDSKYQVNDQTRKLHAKELLGKKYKKSSAAKLEGESLVNTEILILVQNHLPKKHKSKAEKITKAILSEANHYNIDPVFIASIIRTESAFNPRAIGTSGEIGLMQLMPNTGKYIAHKINMKFYGAKTLRDPVKNIKLGAAYFNYLREKFDNKANRYIPAYNMGPGKIAKVEQRKDLPKIYSDKVLKYYEAFYKKIYDAQTLKEAQLASNN